MGRKKKSLFTTPPALPRRIERPEIEQDENPEEWEVQLPPPVSPGIAVEVTVKTRAAYGGAVHVLLPGIIPNPHPELVAAARKDGSILRVVEI